MMPARGAVERRASRGGSAEAGCRQRRAARAASGASDVHGDMHRQRPTLDPLARRSTFTRRSPRRSRSLQCRPYASAEPVAPPERPASSDAVPAVYLLRCADGTLYCGWTVDLEQRIAAHNAGRASRYTRTRLPVELAWSRALPDRTAAMREEARIKQLPRDAKLALIAGLE
jgi:putative endonuclease